MMKACWMPLPPHHLCYILMIPYNELEDAMSQLKARKTGGLSGIVPELVLCGSGGVVGVWIQFLW